MLNIFKRWNTISLKKRLLIIFLNIFLTLLGLYLWGILCRIRKGITFNFFLCIGEVFKSKAFFLIWLFFFVFFEISYIYILNLRLLANPVKNLDERGIGWLKNGTKGTAHELREEEIREIYNVLPINLTKDFLYGQIGAGGFKVVSFKENEFKSGNKATLVLGASGTGKTYSIINNNILCASVRGDSIVVTDPKGELYSLFSEYLRGEGYIVKLINLVESDYSSSWNALGECINTETGDFDTERAKDFATTFMMNSKTTPGLPDEDFWYEGSLSLLEALIGYQAEICEKELKTIYKNYLLSLVKDVSGIDKGELIGSVFYNAGMNKIRENLISVTEKMLKVGHNDAKTFVDELSEKTENKFTLPALYKTFLNSLEVTSEEETPGARGSVSFAPLSKLFSKLSNKDSFSFRMYQTFDNNGLAPNVKASIIQSLLLKLSFLAEDKTSEMLNHDEVNLSLPGKEKCAYFFIVSDQSIDKRVVSSLFFTFLFKDLMKGYDDTPIPLRKERKEVFLLIDEFFSVGRIPSVSTYLSTCRSRKLAPVMVLQNLYQLYELYGDDVAENILSIPDTVIFLGSGTCDEKTPELLSKLSGKGTVETSRLSKDALMGASVDAPFDVKKIQISEDERTVFTLDEIRNLRENELLLMRRGVNVAKLNRFGFDKNPLSKKLTVTEVHGYERISKKYKKAMDFDEKYFSEMLEKIESAGAEKSENTETEEEAADSLIKELSLSDIEVFVDEDDALIENKETPPPTDVKENKKKKKRKNNTDDGFTLD